MASFYSPKKTLSCASCKGLSIHILSIYSWNESFITWQMLVSNLMIWSAQPANSVTTMVSYCQLFFCLIIIKGHLFIWECFAASHYHWTSLTKSLICFSRINVNLGLCNSISLPCCNSNTVTFVRDKASITW